VSVLDGNGKRESEAVVEGSSNDELEFSDARISNISSQVFGTSSSETEADITTDSTAIRKSGNITDGSSISEQGEFDSGSGERSNLSTEGTSGVLGGMDVDVSKRVLQPVEDTRVDGDVKSFSTIGQEGGSEIVNSESGGVGGSRSVEMDGSNSLVEIVVDDNVQEVVGVVGGVGDNGSEAVVLGSSSRGGNFLIGLKEADV